MVYAEAWPNLPGTNLPDGYCTYEGYVNIVNNVLTLAVKWGKFDPITRTLQTTFFTDYGPTCIEQEKRRVYHVTINNVDGIRNNALLTKGNKSTGMVVEGIEIEGGSDNQTLLMLEPLNLPRDTHDVEQAIENNRIKLPTLEAGRLLIDLQRAKQSQDQDEYFKLLKEWKSLG